MSQAEVVSEKRGKKLVTMKNVKVVLKLEPLGKEIPSVIGLCVGEDLRITWRALKWK